MTPARETHLLGQIATLTSLAEAQGFRERLLDQGEWTGAVVTALTQRMDELARKEGTR